MFRRALRATAAYASRALLQPWLRPTSVVALGVPAFSQLTGINVTVCYASTILSDAGFGQSVALVTGIGSEPMLVAAGVTGAITVDGMGRRRTMLWFIPLSGLAMAVLGPAFLMDGSPAQRWVVIIALFACILCDGIGVRSEVWLIAPGVLPLGVRGPATSLPTPAVWGSDLLIALTALSTINAVGRPGTFLLYPPSTWSASCSWPCISTYGGIMRVNDRPERTDRRAMTSTKSATGTATGPDP
nr:MFS transporter [Streptomyces sp. SID10815]